jgi:L-carnitine CoA-transferase
MWANKNLPIFGVLSGVKIVHADQSTAGPAAAALLADYGADMVWVENALAPDITRSGYSYDVESDRRNQRNLALNIPTPEGKQILLRLLADADIFIEASRGGQYAKWGLADDVLWSANPRLVICHVSGFGQTGLPEYVKRPSYDAVAQAFAGYTYVNEGPDNPPHPVGPYAADWTTALFVAISCLAALNKAKETGKGESIDVAQYEVVARAQQFQADWFTAHTVTEFAGAASPFAGWGTYPCADGAYLQLCLIGAGIIKRAVPFMGLEYPSDIITQGQALVYRDSPGGKAFEERIVEYLSAHTADDAQREMQAAGLTVQKVNTLEDLDNDPHVQARGLIGEWTNFKGATVRAVGPVPKFANNPGRNWRPAPWVGMDNEEILQQLGYTDEQVKELYEKKIISHDPDMTLTYPYVKFGQN